MVMGVVMETAGESDLVLARRSSRGNRRAFGLLFDRFRSSEATGPPFSTPSASISDRSTHLVYTPLKVPAPRPARISWKVLGIALALLMLSGCAAEPLAPPTAAPSPTATSHLSTYPTPRDQGPFDGAEGTTTTDSSGKITYTVVSGDSASTIATRFGVYPEQVETLVGGKVGMSTIYPGDKLQFGTRGYT
jgi:hypothetical protein